jgi:hypothetical protein
MYYSGLPREVCEEEYHGIFWKRCVDEPTGHLLVNFVYVDLPEVKITVHQVYVDNPELSGSVLQLDSEVKNPEDSQDISYLWSTDCDYAHWDGDVTASSVNLIPKVTERCMVELTAAVGDAETHNWVKFDIHCVEGWGVQDGGPDVPLNLCALANGCVPTEDACEGLVCGWVQNQCLEWESCGMCGEHQTCSADQTVCEDEECVPDSVPVACGDRVCGDAVNNCGETVSCGTCADGASCSDDQLSCVASTTYICTWCNDSGGSPGCDWFPGCGDDQACARAACDAAGVMDEVGNCLYNGRFSAAGTGVEARVLSVATEGHCKDWLADTSATIPSACMADDGTLTGNLADCGPDAAASYPAASGWCPYPLNGDPFGKIAYAPVGPYTPDCNVTSGFNSGWGCWLQHGDNPASLQSNCADGSQGMPPDCNNGTPSGFISPYECTAGAPTDNIIRGPAPYDTLTYPTL